MKYLRLSQPFNYSPRDPSPFRRASGPQRRLRVLTDPGLDASDRRVRWATEACRTDTIEWLSLSEGDEDADWTIHIEPEVNNHLLLRAVSRDGQTTSLSRIRSMTWRHMMAKKAAAEGVDQRAALSALVSAGVAESRHADVFITDDQYLLATWAGLNGPNIMDLDESLALIGLYQRTSYGKVAWKISSTSRMAVASFLCLETAAEEHIASFAGWFDHCLTRHQLTGELQLSNLARGFISRIASALRALDAVHARDQAGQGELEGGDWQADIEGVIIFLWSAFDVLAHAANVLFSLVVDPRETGWQKKSWRRSLFKEDRTRRLATLANERLPEMTMLFELRNGIHRSPREEGGYSRNSRRTDSVLLLTDAEMRLFDGLGATPAWNKGRLGADVMPESPWVVAAVPFAESVVATALTVLNELLVEIFADPPEPMGGTTSPGFVDEPDDRVRFAALAGLSTS